MSSINSIGSSNSMAMMHGMRRPDPAKMAEQLFDKLDTSGQGYLQKTDFESAFSSISSSGSSSTDVDSLFTQLDGDSDGKVTKQEFSTALSQLSEQLDQQFQSGRMQEAMQMGGMGGPGGMGGMPPPPPPANDEGFSKDELNSQLEEIGSTDSKRASLISSIVENFDAADTDGDGKVSFQEAMAFDQASKTSSSSDSSASATVSTEDSEARVMMQIMKLMQAYMTGDQAAQSSLSVTA
jgi:Ca2+-binding EF-hand superfamily protein